jgi:predicted CopG family antitoxin
MASRTVALDDEAYQLLKSTKRPAESFRDTVNGLARVRKHITEFAGMWTDLSPKEKEALRRTYATQLRADQRREQTLSETRG